MGEPSDGNDLYVRSYVEKAWEASTQAVIHQQTLLTNWLFAVNAGGLGGLLTYVATKGTNWAITTGLIAFFIGLISIIIFSVIMFYWLLGRYRQLDADIGQLYTGKVNFSSFASNLNKRDDFNRWAERLAWISGSAFLLGGVFSAIGIMYLP